MRTNVVQHVRGVLAGPERAQATGWPRRPGGPRPGPGRPAALMAVIRTGGGKPRGTHGGAPRRGAPPRVGGHQVRLGDSCPFSFPGPAGRYPALIAVMRTAAQGQGPG